MNPESMWIMTDRMWEPNFFAPQSLSTSSKEDVPSVDRKKKKKSKKHKKREEEGSGSADAEEVAAADETNGGDDMEE
jgi:hypothetical protein